jgi:hypothetical protein
VRVGREGSEEELFHIGFEEGGVGAGPLVLLDAVAGEGDESWGGGDAVVGGGVLGGVDVDFEEEGAGMLFGETVEHGVC